jgi:hypothetical protein
MCFACAGFSHWGRGRGRSTDDDAMPMDSLNEGDSGSVTRGARLPEDCDSCDLTGPDDASAGPLPPAGGVVAVGLLVGAPPLLDAGPRMRALLRGTSCVRQLDQGGREKRETQL